MQILLLRLGITTFIIAMFFMANHVGESIAQQIFRIFATIGLFQITAMYYLWRTNARRIQTMIEQKVISDDYDKTQFYRSAALSFAIALGICTILYLPNIIALGWVWILSYSIGFYAVFMTLGKYMKIRIELKELRATAQRMLDDETR
ncbi:hypothetical protein EHV15_35280 [Paenibacillus oralis]|uniref:Uncharacterized protein n=1 Tax=Paenibacillus oralis TaxID=2490856 RepID=A0A3P3TCL3_9BACL|nr:hypothetical protein [Paenibacillus oralis]RRJ54838.1 hypothetical protein EHV15_35280 [Paenibacillus oralis]